MRVPHPGRSLLLILTLLAGTVLIPLLTPPVSAYGERILAANTIVSPGDPFYAVYSKQSTAQSFVTAQTASLLNATLRLRNDGSNNNALTVAIHPDDTVTHVPSTTVLASATIVLTGSSIATVSVSFSPAPALTGGEVYWIVATNSAPQPANGYEWHYTDADAYAGGTAAIYNATTVTWATIPFVDMYFVAYGRQLPANVSIAMTVDRARASPQDFVNFTLDYNNSGTQPAPWVWVNESLPAGLTYVADTATGSTTPYPAFSFANLSNGVHSFRVTVRVDVGVIPGTTLTNLATLAFSNATGGVQSGLAAQASVLIGLAKKQLYLIPNSVTPRLLTTTRPTSAVATTLPALGRSNSMDFVQTPALARNLQLLNATSTLWVTSQSGKTQTLVLDLTLYDRNGATMTVLAATQATLVTNLAPSFQSVVATFPAVNVTVLASHQVQLRVTNDPASTDGLLLAVNGTGMSSRLDLLTTTYVSVDGLALMDQIGPTSFWSPFDALAIQANVSDPFGASRIVGIWINVTDPTGSRQATWLTAPVQTDPSTIPGWKLFRLDYATSLVNGTYHVLATAIEDNGVRDAAAADALVRSPAFTFLKAASVVRAKAGDLYAYDLWFNNTGPGPAGQVWINDSLPAQVSFQSWNATMPGAMTGLYNWTWTSVNQGSHRLEVDVQVGSSVNQIAYIRNAATLTFTDEKGHRWPVLASQADVVINGPIVNLSMTSVPSAAVHANESLNITIVLKNSGDPAQTLWANDTEPAGFVYVSDTHDPAWGTASPSASGVSFVFTAMPSGAVWSFRLVLRAPAAAPRGTSVANALDLNYSSLNGVLMPPKAVSQSYTFVSPLIQNATLRFLTTGAGPGDVIPAAATYVNAGNEPATDVWVNLTEDVDLSLVNASVPASVQYVTIAMHLPTVAMGAATIFLNFSVAAGTPDRHTVTLTGIIEYADGAGNAAPTVTMRAAALTVSAALIALSISPGSVTVEAGTAVQLAVYAFNAGSATAADVWLNLTLPSSFDFLQDTSNASRTIAGSSLGWHWSNQVPGPRTFTLSLGAKGNVADGAQANLVFRLDYQDVNHLALPSVNATVRVNLVAPAIQIDLTVDRVSPLAGDILAYSIAVRNNGSTSARWVSITDDVDSRLDILDWTSPVPAIGNRTLTWNLTNLDPGQSVTIGLTVRVHDGIAAHTPLPNAVSAAYSNSLGGAALGYVRSPTVTVTVAADLIPLLWIGLGGLVAMPLLAFVVARRQQVTIEEVFLVYRDGVLISHLSRTLMQDKDEDVLSGMLTAVQEFVRDAFRYGEHRELHQMDFGDYRILIERGKLAYLAVVYSGRDRASVRRRVRAVLDRIEDAYANVLQAWDGDMERVVGVRDMIRDYLLKNTKAPKVTPAPE